MITLIYEDSTRVTHFVCQRLENIKRNGKRPIYVDWSGFKPKYLTPKRRRYLGAWYHNDLAKAMHPRYPEWKDTTPQSIFDIIKEESAKGEANDTQNEINNSSSIDHKDIK